MRNCAKLLAAIVGGYALGLLLTALLVIFGPDVEELFT